MYYYNSSDQVIARCNYNYSSLMNLPKEAYVESLSKEPMVWEIFNEQDGTWEEFPRKFLVDYINFECFLIPDQKKWIEKYG